MILIVSSRLIILKSIFFSFNLFFNKSAEVSKKPPLGPAAIVILVVKKLLRTIKHNNNMLKADRVKINFLIYDLNLTTTYKQMLGVILNLKLYLPSECR